MEPIEEYGADATRYGLLKISSTQDVRFSYGAIEEGRKLAIKLWNVARLILQNAEGVDAGARAARPRGALDPRAPRRGSRRARGRLGRFDFAAVDGDALPPHVRRLLRLVRGGDQAAALRPRRGRDRDGARRARAAARAPAPGDAARHRGDLVAAPRPRGAADRLAVAGGRAVRRRRAALSTACRRRRRSSAAAASRSSSARTTSGGSSPRWSARARACRRQSRRRDRAAAQGGRARRGMLANERFVANAPAEVVAAEREKLERYRRELAASRRATATIPMGTAVGGSTR